jgi:hypothetical protein
VFKICCGELQLKYGTVLTKSPMVTTVLQNSNRYRNMALTKKTLAIVTTGYFKIQVDTDTRRVGSVGVLGALVFGGLRR